MNENITTAKPRSQALSYQNYLKQTWNRNLVIWELRFGAKYPNIKTKKFSYKQIAEMYGFTERHISVIISNLKKKANGGKQI